MDMKFIKIFIGFIVGFIFMLLKPSEVPVILGSGIMDVIVLILNVIGFVAVLYTGYHIFAEIIRITRKR
jgi:hypothetical protein